MSLARFALVVKISYKMINLAVPHSKELAESSKVNVWGTFAMLPSADRIDATLSHHTWRTSRNASIFGTTSRYPPLTVEMQTPPRDVFPRFLANSGTARQLLAEPPSRFKTANGTRIDPSVAPRRLETHSRVTMVRDNYPVYNFTVYNRTLVARADMMVSSRVRPLEAKRVAVNKLTSSVTATSMLRCPCRRRRHPFQPRPSLRPYFPQRRTL